MAKRYEMGTPRPGPLAAWARRQWRLATRRALRRRMPGTWPWEVTGWALRTGWR
jgi:hypothetical protein